MQENWTPFGCITKLLSLMISKPLLPPTNLLLGHVANHLPLWKRILDLFFCLIAAPFFAAVGLLVSIWLALLSPGPVFFKQQRIGCRGRPFMLYKFRTMHADADVGSHRTYFATLVGTNRPMQKLDAARDVRLIRGGWLVRASGLDELPQMINVLRGEMSLVGPRPCIPYEYEQYSAQHRARLASTPGLTGLWQVSGKNRTTFEEMVRLDVKYGRTKSLWLDLKIVVKTLPAILVQIADIHHNRKSRNKQDRVVEVTNRTAPSFQT